MSMDLHPMRVNGDLRRTLRDKGFGWAVYIAKDVSVISPGTAISFHRFKADAKLIAQHSSKTYQDIGYEADSHKVAEL